MPEVRNCRRCGKIFTYMGGTPICQTCKQQDEEDFKRVKDYLYDNPKSSISEISGQLDISWNSHFHHSLSPYCCSLKIISITSTIIISEYDE